MISPNTNTVSLRLPNFVILGAAKAGTTTLQQTLARDERIFMCSPKESNFFSIEYERGLDWYGSLFAEAKKDQLCGEASTIYSWGPNIPRCAARMARDLPDAKLVYLMRHPVDRAYSHYREQIKAHQIEDHREGFLQSFEQYIQQYPHVLEASDYQKQLTPYFEHFDRDRIHLVLMEGLIHQRDSILESLYHFLGLSWQPNAAAEPIAANTHAQFVDWYVRDRVLAPLRKWPVIGHVGRAMPKPLRDVVYRVIERSVIGKRRKAHWVPPAMQDETREALLAHFNPTVRWVGDLLGRDLSDWDR